MGQPGYSQNLLLGYLLRRRECELTCKYDGPMSHPLIQLACKICNLHHIHLGDRLPSVGSEEVSYLLDDVEKSHLTNQSFVRLGSHGSLGESLPSLYRSVLADDRLSRKQGAQMLIAYI